MSTPILSPARASRSEYVVGARYVPPGARVAEGRTRVVYSGSQITEAWDAVSFLKAFARWSTCGGAILIDQYRRGELFAQDVAQVWDAASHKGATIKQTATGYPAHACGGVMVRAGNLGERELYCTRCGEPVSATAAQRLHALRAEAADRGEAVSP